MKYILFILTLVLLVSCKQKVCKDALVMKVGGCDRWGECGAIGMSDVGIVDGIAYLPTEGSWSSICWYEEVK